MKQLNVAILGQGRSGRDIHGLHLKKDTERFKVVAVVEPFDIRRERAAKEYPGCDTYSDYRELLSRRDIDLVINATPQQQAFCHHQRAAFRRFQRADRKALCAHRRGM